MSKILLAGIIGITLFTSCNIENTEPSKVRLIDPFMSCSIDNFSSIFPVQRAYLSITDFRTDTRNLTGKILLGNTARFENQGEVIHIQFQKQFEVNKLKNPTSLIVAQSTGEMNYSASGPNDVYVMTDEEFRSLFNFGHNMEIINNGGSYESIYATGVYLYYSTGNRTYFSANSYWTDETGNKNEPFFAVEKMELLENFDYKNSNEAVDPLSNPAYLITAKFGMNFIDQQHQDTVLINDGWVEFIVYK